MGTGVRKFIGILLLVMAAGVAGVQGLIITLDSPPAADSPS
jgi:hypothetical protein